MPQKVSPPPVYMIRILNDLDADVNGTKTLVWAHYTGFKRSLTLSDKSFSKCRPLLCSSRAENRPP